MTLFSGVVHVSIVKISAKRLSKGSDDALMFPGFPKSFLCLKVCYSSILTFPVFNVIPLINKLYSMIKCDQITSIALLQ